LLSRFLPGSGGWLRVLALLTIGATWNCLGAVEGV